MALVTISLFTLSLHTLLPSTRSLLQLLLFTPWLVTLVLLPPSVITLSPITKSLVQYDSWGILVEGSYFCYTLPLWLWFDNIQGVIWWNDRHPVTPYSLASLPCRWLPSRWYNVVRGVFWWRDHHPVTPYPPPLLPCRYLSYRSFNVARGPLWWTIDISWSTRLYSSDPEGIVFSNE